MPQSSKRDKACNGQANGHHSSHNGMSKQGKNGSHKRSSIPRDVRNDLDKAMVGLCDAWFDKMKPYLVRNNIKVHVTREHEEQTPRPVECSHCDPELLHSSSASSCSLCALLLGAANNIDSAVRQATSNHSPHNFAA